MVTTTTNSIEGQRIVKYKKVLVAQSMIGGKMGCKEGEEPKSVYDMTHEEFVKAESKGRFMNSSIKGKYEYKREFL